MKGGFIEDAKTKIAAEVATPRNARALGKESKGPFNAEQCGGI